MKVKFKRQKEGRKISIIMVLPTEEEKTIITVEIEYSGLGVRAVRWLGNRLAII